MAQGEMNLARRRCLWAAEGTRLLTGSMVWPGPSIDAVCGWSRVHRAKQVIKPGLSPRIKGRHCLLCFNHLQESEQRGYELFSAYYTVQP